MARRTGVLRGKSSGLPRIEAIETGRPAKTGLDAPDAMNDTALLAGLRALSPDAYEVLMDRFEAPLYRFFYYSHGEHDRAEDQCGETFAQAIVAVHKMRGDAGALRSFIFGIARNVLRRGWRNRRTRPISEIELAMLPDRQPSVFRQVADRQAYERAMGAIEQFSEPTRQILLLRFVEGLTLEEIAEAMDLPLGSVKSAIHRARKRLKHLLEESA
jgi:RNA polymerase sigma-70 factor (ECF subfamily)